jgi:hypothetical protein
MSRRWFLLLFGAAAVFCLVMGSCKTEDSGPPPDPVEVDLTPPAVSELPSFEGDLPPNQEAALELAGSAMGLIVEKLSPLLGSFMGSSDAGSLNFSRAVELASFGPEMIWEDEADLIPDAVVTGFIEGRVTASDYFDPEKDEDPSGFDIPPAAGDYLAVEGIRSKIAVIFDDIENAAVAVKGGSFTGSVSADGRLEVGNINPNTGSLPVSIHGNLDVDGGFAMTVFDLSSSQALKAVATLKAAVRINENMDMGQDSEALLENNIDSWFHTFECTLIIYDNDGTEKYRLPYTLDNIRDDISSLFDEDE